MLKPPTKVNAKVIRILKGLPNIILAKLPLIFQTVSNGLMNGNQLESPV